MRARKVWWPYEADPTTFRQRVIGAEWDSKPEIYHILAQDRHGLWRAALVDWSGGGLRIVRHRLPYPPLTPN